MNQKRTIMSACEYSIKSMQNLKKGLMDTSLQDKDTRWAIAGVMSTLTANLIRISSEVITEGVTGISIPNAKSDIREIQKRFNDFINAINEHE